MPFQEKSAWIMSLSLLVGGVFYSGAVASMSSAVDGLAPPVLPLVAGYTVTLVLISIVGHVVIGILTPKEASAKLDERERRIFDRAGNIAGYVMGAGVISSLGAYLLSYSGNLLFYSVFASLMLGQLVEYVVQIFLYRTAV